MWLVRGEIMKKILMFFIILGITIGLLNGMNDRKEDLKGNIENTDQENIKSNNSCLTLAISDIDTLNPLMTKRIHLSNILKLVYEPLFSYDEQNQIKTTYV